MAFMFLRKTICMDFDSHFGPEIPSDRPNYYLCGYKFIVLLLLHVFSGLCSAFFRTEAAILSYFPAEEMAA